MMMSSQTLHLSNLFGQLVLVELDAVLQTIKGRFNDQIV